ncbi:MAG: radical SAM protein [Spirochaetaceae bacterium]|nr:MAG: radical SAM protein [Spirochaetaceae bacterium]
MAISRRGFLKSAALAGGALLFQSHSSREQDPDSVTGATPSEGAARVSGEWVPAYRTLEEEGRFSDRIDEAWEHLGRCDLCPRQCGVNRLQGGRGLCRAPSRVVVYSAQPHFGEEIPLVGRGGSGTIFFSNCNLRCVFCQNWPIAHEGRGREISDAELADLMLALQRLGCHNINVVTPTHVMPHILKATRLAMLQGLNLPLCYNTGGYERPEIVKLLDGIVDIYLPDIKMMNGWEARQYLGSAEDYPEMAMGSVREMHRQVGELQKDSAGIARRGVMIRHLVMPNGIAGTADFVRWVASELTTSTYVNIMAQYRVEHRAFEYPPIARSITSREFVEAMQLAREAGLTNLDERSVMQYQVHRSRV